jgi:hypothetical protein
MSMDRTVTKESVEALRSYPDGPETERATTRVIVPRVAEGRMCRDSTTMIDSCLICSLAHGDEYAYAAKHNEACMVTQTRALGF